MVGYHWVWLYHGATCVWIQHLVPDWYSPEWKPPPGAAKRDWQGRNM